jgi:hypothetical protein
MFKHVFPSIFALAFCATAALAADPAPTMPADAGEAAFVTELQTAIAKKDEAWLAEHATFPMYWNKDAKAVRIKTRGQFADRFEKLMTPDLQAAIAAQKPNEEFRNWQGTMVGNSGRNIWIRKTGDDFRIITINDDSRVSPAAKMQ